MNSASLRQMNADALARFQPFLHQALADDYRMLAMVKMSDVLQAKLEPSQRLAFDQVELARLQFDFVLVDPNDFSVVLAIDVTDPNHDSPRTAGIAGGAGVAESGLSFTSPSFTAQASAPQQAASMTAQQLAAQQAYVQSMVFKASFCKQVNLPLLLLPFADVLKAAAQDLSADDAAQMSARHAADDSRDAAPHAFVENLSSATHHATHNNTNNNTAAQRLTPALLRQKIDAAIAAAQDTQQQWPLQQRAQPYRSKQKSTTAGIKTHDGAMATGEASARQSYAQKAAKLRQRLAYGYSAGALQLTKQWLWSRQALALKGGLLLAVSILLISALRYNTEVPSAALAPTTAAALAPALATNAATNTVTNTGPAATSAVIPGIALEGQGSSTAVNAAASTTAQLAEPAKSEDAALPADGSPAASATVAQLSENAQHSENAQRSDNTQRSESAQPDENASSTSRASLDVSKNASQNVSQNAAQRSAQNTAATARAATSNSQDNTYWKIQPSQAPAVDPVITAQQVCAFRQSEYSGLSNKQNKRLMDRDCSFAKALAAERAQQQGSKGND